MKKNKGKSSLHFIWDLVSVASIIGIWPRYIEPNLLLTTRKTLKIERLNSPLHNLKILQLSDLHFRPDLPEAFLQKIIQKIEQLKPDIIVLTGDLLCYGTIEHSSRMEKFLNQLQAPYGCYFIPGNHDYDSYISINDEGAYDATKVPSSSVFRGFKRLFQQIIPAKQTTKRAKTASVHPSLVSLLKRTPLRLLHNQTIQIPIGNSFLNICGLGEYMAGDTKPLLAFKNYNKDYPGIILLHNPDGIPLLKNYPGEVILCGHTHGGQINIPFLWKKFCILENCDYKKGMKQQDGKWIYINRGLGATLPLRLFSPPEALLLTLETK